MGVLWSRLAAGLGEQVQWLFESRVESIARPTAGRIAVTVAGPGGRRVLSCGRIVSTGRPEDLAVGLGRPDVAARLSQAVGRRDLLVGVVRVHHYPQDWHGYQWLYTHDAGVRAHRFNNFGEWQNLRCPPGVIGLEYTVPAGDSFDVRTAAEHDMDILVGPGAFEFLGAEAARDAYANFDAAGGEFDLLDDALRRFGDGIISTGRQGAGVYINLDQAIRLGTRVAGMPDDQAGVVGRAEYSSYQERMR
ncbi:hypothetical protein B1R94_17855 [Mycolicibacterium litorale]|nr:hypothetical protein B1R94_17855 [Mycolicibacterium litorale]